MNVENSDRFFQFLGSQLVTLLVLLFIAASVLVLNDSFKFGNNLLIITLGLALVNLVTAICTRKVFTRNFPLLVFHLALAALVILVGLGRLTYFQGHLELAEGESFRGSLIDSQSGPLHQSTLHAIEFTNDGFTVDYLPGIYRNATVNRISYKDEFGQKKIKTIGDHRPLILDNYRFYTTFNKGFALTFAWSPSGAETEVGTVNLPSFPDREHSQAQSWIVPGTDESLWVMLLLDEDVVKPEQSFTLHVPDKHHIVVRRDNLRFELWPGDTLELQHGVLTYEGLRLWMGYRVYYDWTRPWSIAACILSILGMSAYYLGKFVKKPLAYAPFGALRENLHRGGRFDQDISNPRLP